MKTIPRGHDNWIVYGKDEDGNSRHLRCLFYTRREAVKQFRERYNVVGKRNVIESIVPQFGWY